MAQIINVSIDLTKIDKSKIADKNGKKWYNFQLSINDEKDNYGNDGAIWEQQSKEERETKKPKNYLGNARVSWSSEAKQEAKVSEPTSTIIDEDLPF